MEDLILVVILVGIIGSAIAYIVKSKKQGVKCIGCPAAGNCQSKKQKKTQCDCGCH